LNSNKFFWAETYFFKTNNTTLLLLQLEMVTRKSFA